MALYRIVDAQNAIKLRDALGICVEIDESVVGIGQTVHLVGKFALAPFIDIVDSALPFGDSGLDALHNACARLFIDGRSDKKQQFISLHQLTSSGLNGPG